MWDPIRTPWSCASVSSNSCCSVASSHLPYWHLSFINFLYFLKQVTEAQSDSINRLKGFIKPNFWTLSSIGGNTLYFASMCYRNSSAVWSCNSQFYLPYINYAYSSCSQWCHVYNTLMIFQEVKTQRTINPYFSNRKYLRKSSYVLNLKLSILCP